MENNSILGVICGNDKTLTVNDFIISNKMSEKDVEMCGKTILVYTMTEDMKLYQDMHNFIKFISNDIANKIPKTTFLMSSFRENIKINVCVFFQEHDSASMIIPDYYFDDCAYLVLYAISDKCKNKPENIPDNNLHQNKYDFRDYINSVIDNKENLTTKRNNIEYEIKQKIKNELDIKKRKQEKINMGVIVVLILSFSSLLIFIYF